MTDAEPAAQSSALRLLRVIARLNVGGPAIQAITLSRLLEDEGFATTLVRGVESEREGAMDPLAHRLGVQPVLLRCLRRELRPLDDVRATLALRRIIRRQRPAILHTHTAKAGTLGRLAAVLSGRRRPALVIHTFHGHVLSGYFSRWAERLFTGVERALARHTDVLIAVSEEVRRDLLTRGIGRPEQVRVVHLGFDLERFSLEPDERARARARARARLGVPADAPLVAIVARVVPIKRIDIFLAAAELVAARHPSARFCVAGDGELFERLRGSAPSRRLGHRLSWPGFVEDTPGLYAASDVVVLCSDNEGTPVSLIEAQAAGCAVVATRVGGVGSVVEHGRNGLLVEAGDAQALAEALSELLGDASLRRRLGAEGRALVHRRFPVARLVLDLANLYRSELKARG